MAFHTGQTFVFGEVPAASKWQFIWDNDYALADGSGISAGAITAAKLAAGAVGNVALGLSMSTSLIKPTNTSISSTSYTDVTAGSLAVTCPAGAVLIIGSVGLQNFAGGQFDMYGRVVMDGSPSAAGGLARTTQATLYNGATCTLIDLFTGVSAGSHTFKLQARSSSGATTGVNADTDGTIICIIPLSN